MHHILAKLTKKTLVAAAGLRARLPRSLGLLVLPVEPQVGCRSDDTQQGERAAQDPQFRVGRRDRTARAAVAGARHGQPARVDAVHLPHTDADGRAKYYPLADWSLADVWHYVQLHDVPYNTLHDQDFMGRRLVVNGSRSEGVREPRV